MIFTFAFGLHTYSTVINEADGQLQISGYLLKQMLITGNLQKRFFNLCVFIRCPDLRSSLYSMKTDLERFLKVLFSLSCAQLAEIFEGQMPSLIVVVTT